MVRVPNPAGMGIRVNGPADGWLTNPGNYVGQADWAGTSHSDLPDTSFWDGIDHGFGFIGPGSWSGAPWSSMTPMGFAGARDDDCCTDRTPGESLDPAVTRCTDLIKNAVVRTPWVLEVDEFRVDKKSERLDLPLWIRDPMLVGTSTGTIGPSMPAPYRLVAHAFWSQLLERLMWWGRAGFVCEIEADGLTPMPGTLRLVNPFNVHQAHVEGVGPVWAMGDPNDPVLTNPHGHFQFDGKLHRLVMMSTGAPGILVAHWDQLRISAAVSRYIVGAFSSPVPSGYLKSSKPDLTQEMADKLKQRWSEAHGKSAGRRSVAVLNAVTDYVPVQWNATDANAEGLERISRQDIALMFNLDPIMVGEGASGLTYSSDTGRRRAFVDQTGSGWAQLLMENLSALLPLRQTLRVNWAEYTEGNPEEKATVYLGALNAGAITINEYREKLNLAPLPESGSFNAAQVAAVAQKAYLAVGKMLSPDEAREIVRAAGMPIPAEAPDDATNAILVQPELPDTPDQPDDQPDHAEDDGDEGKGQKADEDGDEMPDTTTDTQEGS